MNGNLIQDVVRARRFELIGQEDQLRVEIEQRDGGVVSMNFFDAGGTIRMSAGLGLNGTPNVTLFALNTIPRLSLFVDEHGGAQICGWNSNDGNAPQCFQLTLPIQTQTPSIIFRDTTGAPRVVIGLANGNGQVGTIDKDGAITSL